MKYPLLLTGSVALIFYATGATALTNIEIRQLAQAATVTIKLQKSNMRGTGVIIHRQQDLYTLVTTRHIVCGRGGLTCKALPKNETYNIGTNDQQQYSAQQVKLLGNGLDLAIVQFRSSRNYPVATIANNLKSGSTLYTSGYAVDVKEFVLNEGQALAVVNKRLATDRGGYTVVYNAVTKPGMGGGGVFDTAGQLVAIHGIGDRYMEGSLTEGEAKVGAKTGYNRGIPAQWLVAELAKLGIKVGKASPIITTKPSADEYFIMGLNKWIDPGQNVVKGKTQAVQELNRAIELNPKYAAAYFLRGTAQFQLQNFRPALADFDQAISLNPKSAIAYYSRGLIKSQQLNDAPGALTDYTKAIELYPQYAMAYNNRANLRKRTGDAFGALADYDQAIGIDPQYALAFNNRGLLKQQQLQQFLEAQLDFTQAIRLQPQYVEAYLNRAVLRESELKNNSGALSDYDEAIKINPKLAKAYVLRATFYYEKVDSPPGALLDYNKAIELEPQNITAYLLRGILYQRSFANFPAAMADFNRAIALDPKSALAYNRRGNLKSEDLKDPTGAIADYNRAIALASEYAAPYYNRAGIKNAILKDRAGAILDYQRAASLFQKQNKAADYQDAIEKLKELGSGE
jgi:tetratricopeptide (TPR) repeat protein